MKTISGPVIFIMAFVLIIPFLFCGCARDPHPDKTIAKINNYYMSVDDFKADLDTTFVNERGTLSNEDVLDLAIKRELLVQEAQRQGLDKHKTFMKTIERYWKQTLIKELLDKKTKDVNAKERLSQKQKNEEMMKWYDNLYKKARIKKNMALLEELK